MPRDRSPPKDQNLFAAFDEAANAERTAHLPATLPEAIPYFRGLLERLHAAVLARDEAEATRLKAEAFDLAIRLNGGTNFGILAGEDAPAKVLEREAAAPGGTPPIWGQVGDVQLVINGAPVRAAFSGVFGIGFPAFSAHAIDPAQPFISETGYRSFLQGNLSGALGLLPAEFARACIDAHIKSELKGKLKPIAPEYWQGFGSAALSPDEVEGSILAVTPEELAESTGGPHPDQLPLAVLPVEPSGDSAPEADFVLSQDFNRERTPMRNKSPPRPTGPPDIAALVTSLSHRHGAWQVFSDFCEIAAIALSNAVDLQHRERREARYMEIVRRYEPKEMAKFPEMLGALTLALEAEPSDVLGRTFHELELHNKWAGQFFSPYPLCRMMAAMTLGGEAELRERISQRGFITASEPAVGSGAMVIALAHNMKDLGINYQQHLHVTAVDVDAKCVHMAFLQLALLHIPAVIVHGNSLTLEERDQWHTPAHILGGWRFKLARAESAEVQHEVKPAPAPAESETKAPATDVPARGQLTLF